MIARSPPCKSPKAPEHFPRVSADRRRPIAPTPKPRRQALPPNLPDDFETEEMAKAEDTLRIKGLIIARPLDGRMTWANSAPRLRFFAQRLPHLREPHLDRDAITRIIIKLNSGLTTPSTSLASSVTMRLLRKALFEALLTALKDHSLEDLRTFTVINQSWRMTPDQFEQVTAEQIKMQFRTHLNRIGVLKMPGVFIAILHGEFEPTSGTYLLHFHGLTTREKAEALSKLTDIRGYVPTETGAAPIKVKPVRDLPRQLTYIAKGYWPMRAVRMVDGAKKRDRVRHRIREPFASQVLLWLDRQRFRDLTIMNDVWSRRKGGPEAMKAVYLSVQGPW